MSKPDYRSQDNGIVGHSLTVLLATVLFILPWVEASAQTKLVAPDGATYDQFGASVAISGDTAVVGIANAAGAGAPGAAYIFVRSGASWTYQAKLTAADNGNGGIQNQFGASVAISGDTVVVGDANAFTNDGSYLGRYGAVYVFTRGDGSWPMQARLLANQKVDNDSFANSVAISGETVFIGASLDNFSTQGSSHGAVYVFIRNGTNWVQDAFLKASDGASNDQFGTSVGLNGDTGIIGAPNKDGKGAAYIFVRSDTGWSQQAQLASGGAAGDHFGSSVAIDGNTAIVGMNPYDTPTGPQGFAAVFVRDGTTWSGQQTLVGDAYADRFFSHSVAISGDQVLIGDPYDNPNSIQVPGAAYLFVRNGSKWSQQSRLTASDAAVRDVFGLSVGINSDGRLLVGAPGHDINTIINQGEAYVFDADTDGDGIPDEWEKNGVTVDSTGVVTVGNTGNGVFINLPAMGADPKHKDIFIHTDWMQNDPADAQSSFKPDPRAIKMVTDSFAVAPVNNPDGTTGINLHVDCGPDSIMNPVTEQTWGTLSQAGEVPFQEPFDTSMESTRASLQVAFDAIKATHFDASKRSGIFHYALYAKTYSGKKINGGISPAAPDSSFLVALGRRRFRAPTPIPEACSFMHELGHNLGLDHGGSDEVNYKPNYLSVMNYRYERTGPRKMNGHRAIDYSRRMLNTLDETKLDEIVGINDPDGFITTWNPFARDNPNACADNFNSYETIFYPTAALDWNCDGTGSTTPVSVDLNSDGRCVRPGKDGILHSTPTGGDLLIGPFMINGRSFGPLIVSGANRVCGTTAGCDASGQNCDVQENPVGAVEPTLLTGFNDWPELIFNGGGKIGTKGETSIKRSVQRRALNDPNAPLNERSLDDLEIEVPQPVLDEELLAPLDVVTRSPQTGVAPLTVSFDGTGSVAMSGTIVDWSWDFGDGSTGSGATTTHTYSAPGIYFASLTVTDSNGQVNLVPLLNRVTVADAAAVTGQLLNISTRLRALTDDNVLIGGFIVTGTISKKVIIRGLGPSLGNSGVAGALADPTLELHQGSTTIASNDNWKDSQQQEIEDTTIPPTNDAEAAIVMTLNPGAYTAVLAGKNQTSGIGLVEVYDLSQSADSKLANISTRGFVDTGDSAMIGGFIIGGASGGSGKVIVRAIGPSLPVAGVLADPMLEIHDSNGALIAMNDNWRSDHEADIIATTIPPANDLESAVVETLPAGPYTAIVSGVNGTTGVALVEVYSLQ